MGDQVVTCNPLLLCVLLWLNCFFQDQLSGEPYGTSDLRLFAASAPFCGHLIAILSLTAAQSSCFYRPWGWFGCFVPWASAPRQPRLQHIGLSARQFVRAEGPKCDSLGWSESDEWRPR